jgi:hypothetical protein
LGLSQATTWGPSSIVVLGDGVLLQFAEPPVDIQMQHYAFLVDDETFDAIYARVQRDRIEHWADPRMSIGGQVNTNHGGRGFYFKDLAGHGMELITGRTARRNSGCGSDWLVARLHG